MSEHAAPFHPIALVVHHSASIFGDVKQITEWHKARGFKTIGYHAVILNGCRHLGDYEAALDGHISAGRSEYEMGAHCEAKGMNFISLGVCLVGDSTRDGFTDKQISALVHYLATKCRRYKIPITRIYQHSQFDRGKPYCAGVNIEMIRKLVGDTLAVK